MDVMKDEKDREVTLSRENFCCAACRKSSISIAPKKDAEAFARGCHCLCPWRPSSRRATENLRSCGGGRAGRIQHRAERLKGFQVVRAENQTTQLISW